LLDVGKRPNLFPLLSPKPTVLCPFPWLPSSLLFRSTAPAASGCSSTEAAAAFPLALAREETTGEEVLQVALLCEVKTLAAFGTLLCFTFCAF